MTLNVQKIRDQFPILNKVVNNKPLVYFDNAATTQKPKSVIEAISGYYNEYNANIHRGIHTLAEEATSAFEDSRTAIADFISVKDKDCIIFTTGTTDSINLVAHSFASAFIEAGDEIIISGMEHHSNIVPWQIQCELKGAILKVIPVLDNGTLDMKAFHALLNHKTKLISVVHISNSLGTVNPIKEIIDAGHQFGAKVLIDGAQASTHIDLHIDDWDADFYALSFHKLFGPTGTGMLYGKRALLEKMPPYRSGGEMIKDVSFEKTTYNALPYKFEAGTPNIADIIAIKKAIDFVNEIGKEAIRKHEKALVDYATSNLLEIEGLRIIGTAPNKMSVISFVIEGVHHFDIGQMLDAKGVAIRTGHHCTQPLMKRFGIEGTARASFSIYNTKEEIDTMVSSLKKVVAILK